MIKNILITLLVLLNIHLAYETSKYVNKSKKLEQENLKLTYKTDSEVDLSNEYTPTVMYEKIQDTLGNVHIDTLYRFSVIRSKEAGNTEPDVYSLALPDSGGYDHLSLPDLKRAISIYPKDL